jgi:hypothetical protein
MCIAPLFEVTKFNFKLFSLINNVGSTGEVALFTGGFED